MALPSEKSTLTPFEKKLARAIEASLPRLADFPDGRIALDVPSEGVVWLSKKGDVITFSDFAPHCTVKPLRPFG